MTAEEIVKEVEAAQAQQVEAEAPAKPKATRARKRIDGDAELAKKRGTFAVGIQAAMRDLLRNR